MHPETYLPLHHLRAQDLIQRATTPTWPTGRATPRPRHGAAHAVRLGARVSAPLSAVASRVRREADRLLEPQCCPA